MSKNKNNNETINEEVKVNTPERTDEMDEREENKQQDEFFNDEDSNISDSDDNGTDDESKDSADDQDGDKKKTGILKTIGGFFGGIKRHWKGVVIGTVSLVVIGGVVFYVVGKKQIKLGKVEDVAKALEAKGKEEDVINFAEAMEELAKDMKENPENHEVANF